MNKFVRTQKLKMELQEAWDFFSNPANLALITPPELGFRINTNLPERIYDGLEIDYKVTPLLGIPLSWKTLISDVYAPLRFTDIQIKGPYLTWRHEHVFEKADDGVLVRDTVNYELPFGPVGRMANKFFIRKKINSIFDFREAKLNSIFNN